MGTIEQNTGFVFNKENFDAVTEQLKTRRHQEFLQSAFTMVQKNRKGNCEVTDDNIKTWARRVFKND